MKEAIQFFNKHEINDIKFMLDSPLGLGEFEYLHDELRRIVDAWELVQSYGGLTKAKIELSKQSILRWINPKTELLREAIALVEEVESLGEVS